MAFSPDGQSLASGSKDQTMRLWNVESGEELRQFQGHTGEVLSVAFSPDGQILASASSDSTMRLWNVESGEGLRQFQRHSFAKIGKIKVKNVSDHNLKAQVYFKTSNYMDDATAVKTQIELEPEQSLDIPLRAIFEPEILNIKKQERLTGKIEIVYSYARAQHKTKANVDFLVYGKNSIIWDKPEKAVAFMTPQDEIIQSFSKAALKEYEGELTRWIRENRLFEALQIYEVLRNYKVSYVGDENSGYALVADKKFPLDNILYPGDFLRQAENSRAGDCDDLSVLYSTLLESRGINTSLLSVPGHLFMMFNTQIPIDYRYSLPLFDNLLVPYKGTLWIPIDPVFKDAKLGEFSFTAAWERGARIYKQWNDSKKLEIIDVATSRQIYPSAIPPAPTSKPFRELTDSDISEFLKSDIATLENWKSDFVNQYKLTIADKPDSLQLRNELGVVYAQIGEFREAENQFRTILRDTNYAPYAPAMLNLGNLIFIAADSLYIEDLQSKAIETYQRAKERYQKAKQLDPHDWRTYMNLAVLYQTLLDVDKGVGKMSDYQKLTEENLTEAAKILGGIKAELLNLPGEELEKKAGWLPSRKKIKETLKKLKVKVDSAFKQYLTEGSTKKVQLDEVAGPKAGDDADFRSYILWWKV